MDEEEGKEVRCPRCGGMPTVQNLGYSTGFKMYCAKHTNRYEVWGETYTEAEDAWIKYCARVRREHEDSSSKAG